MSYSFGERLIEPGKAIEQRQRVFPILSAALEAVDPYAAVRRALVREGDRLHLGHRLSAGAVNVKRGHAEPTRLVRLQEAGHPIPDEAGVLGTHRIVNLIADAQADDLVICLISGGGSALVQ